MKQECHCVRTLGGRSRRRNESQRVKVRGNTTRYATRVHRVGRPDGTRHISTSLRALIRERIRESGQEAGNKSP